MSEVIVVLVLVITLIIITFVIVVLVLVISLVGSTLGLAANFFRFSLAQNF